MKRLKARKTARATRLSHYGKGSQVAMVDVTAKEVTARVATARGFISIGRAAFAAIRRRKTPKGDPLEIARIAGIAAAKRTAEWIPLCHPLPLTHIDVTARLCQNKRGPNKRNDELGQQGVEIRSRVTATARTGVEMEALVAVSAAALTVYDMCKALDPAMEIGEIHLLEKTGGTHGTYLRSGGQHSGRAGRPPKASETTASGPARASRPARASGKV